MLYLAIKSLIVAAPLAVSAFPGFTSEDYAARGAADGAAIRESLAKRGAAPYSPKFPYTGATLGGGAGTGVGGIRVPAPGDYAHYYQDPPPGAQRGPCPGLNTLANHGFLSRDGITTWDELVAAMQNVFNVDYATSAILATLGIAADGDVYTEKLSIGGDATAQTGEHGMFVSDAGGLSRHNTFEVDVSLTRNDFYLNGDAGSFNATLFGMMTATVASTSSKEDPLYDFNGIALYRAQRYNQSKAENPFFYFPEVDGLHAYGAAAFLYEVFPSYSNNMKPDKATIASFFGAVERPDGTFGSQPERIPPNYTNRLTPYTLADIGNQTTALYAAYPVTFGGNDGKGNFIPLNSNASSSAASARRSISVNNGIDCGIYTALTSLSDCAPQPLALLSFVTAKLNPVFEPLGCTLVTMP